MYNILMALLSIWVILLKSSIYLYRTVIKLHSSLIIRPIPTSIAIVVIPVVVVPIVVVVVVPVVVVVVVPVVVVVVVPVVVVVVETIAITNPPSVKRWRTSNKSCSQDQNESNPKKLHLDVLNSEIKQG